MERYPPQDSYGMQPGEPYGDSQYMRTGGGADQSYYPPNGAAPEYQGTGNFQESSYRGPERTYQDRKIDSNTGIAPKRLTDFYCLFVLIVYIIGMIIIVSVAKSRGDIRRLTHGMDYKTRVCGVDPEVQDRPYVFWCRDKLSTPSGLPTKINFQKPSCVSSCPTALSTETVACLQEGEKTFNQILPGGQFGNVQTMNFEWTQSVVLTQTYPTKVFGGRYCMPEQTNFKSEALNWFIGPVNIFIRVRQSFGSFQDCWGVIWLAAILAIILGYVYIFAVRTCDKAVIFIFLGISLIVFTLGTLFFLYAAFNLWNIWGTAPSFLKTDLYKEKNPLYGRSEDTAATILSIVVGVVLLICTINMICILLRAKSDQWKTHEMIRAATECVIKMPILVVPPVIEAFWKLILAHILCYNFMYLVSCGWFEDYPIVVDGIHYGGLSRQYFFDWSMLIWIAYYIFGGVWIMEICNSFGQFLCTMSAMKWYFMEKEGNDKPYMSIKDAFLQRSSPSIIGYTDLLFHVGSIVFGAAFIPWLRFPRFIWWVVNQGCSCCKCCIGGCCYKATRRGDTEGVIWKLYKNAYLDVLIRSTDFVEGGKRASLVMNDHNRVREFHMQCQIISIVAVVFIGSCCSGFTYLMVTSGSYADPASPYYIYDPTAVSVLAFVITGYIAYGFSLLYDHTADVLLYAYSWNKKTQKNFSL